MASGKGACVALTVVLALLGVNAFFWWRWAAVRSATARLVDGTCTLQRRDVFKAGHKELRSIPLIGPKWTVVPCMVDVTIWAVDGSRVETTANETWVSFIYEQGIFPNVFTDTCSKIVPESEATFKCSYAGDDLPIVASWDGQAIAAPVVKLPPMVTVQLMKASGLSLMTLGPLSLILACSLKNALFGKQSGVSARSLEAADDAPEAPQSGSFYTPLPGEQQTPEAF